MAKSAKSTMTANSTPTLTDRITTMLATQIKGGVYPVNARLPTEAFMTKEYGVSRTVIREAIARLRSQGLVETRQGSGTVVLAPSNYESFRLSTSAANHAQGVIHILELRQGIETEMAALAAINHNTEQLEKIQQAFHQLEESTTRGGDGVEADLAFHIAIANASNNPHFLDLLSLLTRHLQNAIRVTRSNEATAQSLTEQVKREHLAILNAITERNPEQARTAAFKHMCNTIARLQAAEESFWTGPDGKLAQRLGSANLRHILKNK